MRVIVADAAAANRSAWRTLAENFGIAPKDVLEASDVATLLKLVSAGEVNLVVFAWNLSGYSGFTLLGELRQKRGDEVPAIAVGEAADKPALEAAVKGGLLGWVTRPVDGAVLGKKIRAALFGKEVVAKVDDHSRTMIRNAVSSAAAEADLPFFMQLSSQVMDAFLKLSVRKKCPAGITLIERGHAVEQFHVLTLGQLEIQDTDRPTRVIEMGECFGEVAFLREEPSLIIVKTRTASEVNSLDRSGLAELIRRHPSLSSVLSDLVSRRTSVRLPRPAVAPPSGMGGSLGSMPFPDLIQMLNSTRKSGVLTIEDGDRKAGIVLEEGEVRHAWVGAQVGEAAFNQTAGWKKGLFYFRPGGESKHPVTIQTGTIALLMEAMRLVDEASSR